VAPNTTRRVAGFVADLEYDHVPPEVVAIVKRQVLDVVGVALAGMRAEIGRIVTRYAEIQASRPMIRPAFGEMVMTFPPRISPTRWWPQLTVGGTRAPVVNSRVGAG